MLQTGDLADVKTVRLGSGLFVRLTSPISLATLLPALSAGTAFVVNILSARALGPGARGTVALSLQASYILAPLLLLGRDRAILRRGPNVSSTFWPLVLMACLLAAPVLRGPLWLSIPIAWVTGYLSLSRARTLVGGSPMAFACWSVAFQACILVGSAALFVFDVRGPAWWLAPYAFPACVIAALELKRTMGHKCRSIGPMFRYASLAPASVGPLLVMRLDRLALPAFQSVSELGLYVAVATATEPLAWFAQAHADHSIGRARGTRRGLIRSLSRILPIVGVLSVLAGAAVFLLVGPVLGADFRSARWLSIPLSAAAVCLVAYRLAISQLLGSSNPKLASRAEIVTAFCAVPIYGLLIWQYGMYGAAAGSMLVYLAGAIIGFVLLPQGGGRDGVLELGKHRL